MRKLNASMHPNRNHQSEMLLERWQIVLSGPNHCDLLVKITAPPGASDAELRVLALQAAVRKTKIFAKNRIPLDEPAHENPVE
jgi:hypothetical protein